MPDSILVAPRMLFCICFGLMLIAMLIMGRQGRHFYSIRRTVRVRFSILDMEFPSSWRDLLDLLHGTTKLGPDESERTRKAVRRQLVTDTALYMPATYGLIFLLCFTLGRRSDIWMPLQWLLTALGWAQLLALILDAIENALFWRMTGTKALSQVPQKLSPNEEERYHRNHRRLMVLEGVKWGLALLGVACGLSALLFLFFQGRLDGALWQVFLIILAEILAFLAIKKLLPE